MVRRTFDRQVRALAAVALLAGCNGTAASVAPEALPASWMSPGAASQALLYVTNSGLSSVDVYAWPALTRAGTLSGFQIPYAECVDGAGNVYIVDYGARQVDEYRHGGSKAFKTYADEEGNPIACSVDKMTGNLAVSNLTAGASKPGNVLVFPQGTGKPTKYTAPGFRFYWFVGYDDRSNLFVDGEAPSVVALAELPKGGATFEAIAMNQSIAFPGDVQWDGKYLAVGDQRADRIYQFAISGKTATEKSSSSLGGASDVFQFWITGGTTRHPQGTEVVGASYGSDKVELWKYPAGGSPLARLAGFYGPNGVVISPR